MGGDLSNVEIQGRSLFQKLFRRRERQPVQKSEKELRLEAFEVYQKRLAGSKDSAVRSVASALQSKVQSLSSGFSLAKKESPTLTARDFLEKETRGYSHLTIEGPGWNPRDASVSEWARVKHEKGQEWGILTSLGVSDLLVEKEYISDARFVKSDRPSFDSIAYAVASDFGGTQSESASFGEYWATVRSPETSKAGIFVGLKKEEKSNSSRHDYFTGHEGGIRGVAVLISADTIAAAVEKQVFIQVQYQ